MGRGRGKTALIAVQPGLVQTEKVSLCTLAAEVCRGCEGSHEGMEMEYLRGIQNLGHLSVFEHARYCSHQWIKRYRREYGRTLADYMESVNARYVIEHNGYNPLFKFGIKDVDYHKMTDAQKLAHASATFIIEASRICAQQQTRHRKEASYSMQSQRHVAISEGSSWYVTPDTIEKDKSLCSWYNDLHKEMWEFYQCAQGYGVPLEDARYILPGSTLTRLMATMPFEGWVHFIELRVDPSAQWEIREDVAEEIKQQLIDHDPELFMKVLP